MKKKTVVALLVCSLFVAGAYPAEAHEAGKPMTKKAQKIKCDEMKKMNPMHEMILETHAILLDTIKLVEKSGKDDETTKDAQALASRLENLIQKHKAMHENMMKEMCNGKMPREKME